LTATGAICFTEHGGPEVLEWSEVAVPDPGPGEVLVRHAAVGINFADTYFRAGVYPVELPSGLGVEAAGVVEAVGSGVDGFTVGSRVTYTGSPLGAYCTMRTMPVDSLIALPDAISFETAAAMTMRGLTAAYLLRRIWPLEVGDTVLLHAAAGGVGLIVCQWGRLLGLRVIGTTSTQEKADVARAHGCDHVLVDPGDELPRAVRDLTDGMGVRVVYDGIGHDTFEASLRSLGRRGLLVCLGTASGPVPAISAFELGRRGSLFVTRPALADYISDRAERAALADELFDHVEAGRIAVEVNQHYELADAARAHRDLEGRRTIGSSIFLVPSE
jgi:NADPH2:quinone reductase